MQCIMCFRESQVKSLVFLFIYAPFLPYLAKISLNQKMVQYGRGFENFLSVFPNVLNELLWEILEGKNW